MISLSCIGASYEIVKFVKALDVLGGELVDKVCEHLVLELGGAVLASALDLLFMAERIFDIE
jgi:hypothetical protein